MEQSKSSSEVDSSGAEIDQGNSSDQVGSNDMEMDQDQSSDETDSSDGDSDSEYDTEEAIALHRQVLQLLPQGHPERSSYLTALAKSLQYRYHESGTITDLEEAITLHREALRLLPQAHSNRSSYLNNVANSLETRYEALGMSRDLEEAVALHREALQLQPQGHPDRSSSLCDLATALRSRYKVSGTLQDLEEAIALHREALQQLPQDHPERSFHLNHLAASLQARYEGFSMLPDLEEAIALHREALRLQPQGDSDRTMSMLNLANSLRTKYQLFGVPQDLEEAIVLHREVLQLRPQGRPGRSPALNSLANSLRTQYERSGVLAELDEAIALYREAMQLLPEGHPYKSLSFINFANSLQVRYLRSGVLTDLEEAIMLHRDALETIPQGHPDRVTSLHSLAQSMVLMHGANLHGPVASEIQRLVLETVDYSYASAGTRLQLALQWAHSTIMDIHFRLQLHRKSLLLLQQVLLVNPDFAQQESRLSVFGAHALASAAAATAIQAHDVKEAITLLDLGRSILFSTLQRYRTRLDALRAVDSNLADELKAVASQLEHLTTLHDHPANLPQHITALDHALSTQRESNQRWDDLLSRIRNLSGFEDFLGIPSYIKLQEAAKHGPLIFLNASQVRTDAVIMTFTGEPILVDLPNASWTKLKELAELVERARTSDSTRRTDLLHVLRSLWDAVVAPIVDKLIFLGIKPRSRIW